MPFAPRQVKFTGAAPKGVGKGYPSRGVYQIRTADVNDAQSNNGNLSGIEFVTKVEAAFVVGEKKDGKDVFTQDNGRLGSEIRKLLIWWPDGRSEGGDRAREAELKAALLSHGNGTAEQLASDAGTPMISPDMFIGKNAYLLYDPPPRGTKEYPEWSFISQAQFQRIVSGEARVTWPYDGYVTGAAKAAARTAAPTQTGAGSMLAGLGAPQSPASAVSGFAGAAPAAPAAPMAPGNGVNPASRWG